MTIKLKSMTRVVSWLMALALSFTFALPVEAIEFFPTPFRFEWSAQSGTLSADGTAYEYTVSQGDTVSMSLSVTNRSTDGRALVMYGIPPGGNLLPEVAPYRGAHELRIGVKNDEILPWLDASSFIENLDGDNNRLSVYDGPNVHQGSNVTFTWDVKIADDAVDGIYEMQVSMVREFDAWATNIDGGNIFWRFNIGDTSYVPPVNSGDLAISASPGTPIAAMVATGGNANFTKFTLTAAVGKTVEVSSIYVTRDGLSTDAEVENVKLLDASMIQKGNTAGGFDANHKAQVFFSPTLSITGSHDFYLRAGFTSTATANHTARLGVASISDIVSNATAVTGPPVYGNYMSVIDIDLGSITVSEDGSITDGTPDVGDTDVVVNAFKLTSGFDEDITIEQITVNKAGSADSSDSINIELWDVTHNVSLGEVAGWSADDKAVFSVNIPIAQGTVLRYRIQLDIVDGSGLTVNADIVDGSDALVVAKGDLYGYYITPACTVADGDWDLDASGSNNLGQGDKNQTINPGSLVISKSTSTAPTGSITQASDQILGTWDFEARGESIRISAISIDLDGTAVDTNDETIANIKSARIYDENGNIVAGPVNGTTTSGVENTGVALDRDLDFTNTFVIPVGVHQYTLKANIQTGAENGETIIAAITADGDVTAKTIRTNTSITATGPPSTLNTMMVKAGALVSTTLTAPIAAEIVPGVQDHIWMTGEFSALNSGEDILITAAEFQFTSGSTADVDELKNQEIWADITDGSSPRGDIYETQLSKTKQNSDNAADADPDITFNFDMQTLTVAKGTAVSIAFIGDLSAAASSGGGATDTLLVAFDTDDSDITASGKDTGTPITTAPTLATGGDSTQTIVANGVFTITTDSSTPLASLLAGNSISKVLVTTWRMAASIIEDIRIDDIKISSESTALDDLGTVYLYSDRDQNGALVDHLTNEIASGSQIGAATTYYMSPDTSLRPVVPADGYARIYAYVDTPNVDGTVVANGDNIRLNIETVATDVNVTGIASGATWNPTGDANCDGGNHALYKSYPTVTLSPLSPSGNLTIGANTTIAIWRITADAADDITMATANYSSLVVQFIPFVTDLTGAAITSQLVETSTGTVLATPTDVTWSGTPFVTKSEIEYLFEDNTLTVSAGDYKDISVQLTTTTWEDTGDSITVGLDNVDADFTWSVNLSGAYSTGVISFRGDPIAHTLVKAG